MTFEQRWAKFVETCSSRNIRFSESDRELAAMGYAWGVNDRIAEEIERDKILFDKLKTPA